MSTQNTEVIVWGIEFIVDYEYDRGEPQVDYYPDGSGNPGSPPSVEIYGIYLDNNDQDILDAISQSCIDKIEEQILESYE